MNWTFITIVSWLIYIPVHLLVGRKRRSETTGFPKPAWPAPGLLVLNLCHRSHMCCYRTCMYIMRTVLISATKGSTNPQSEYPHDSKAINLTISPLLARPYGLDVHASQFGTSNPNASIHAAQFLITLQLIQPSVICLSNRQAYLWSGLEPRTTGNFCICKIRFLLFWCLV
jgi:hypothetical protein